MPLPHWIVAVSGSPKWQESVREAFAKVPDQVVERESGNDLIKLLRDEGERVDVVILDSVLESETGLSALRRLREEADMEGIPVMILSCRGSEMDRILAFENGADDFLPIPFYERELVSRAHALIRRGRDRDRASSRSRQLSFGPVGVEFETGTVTIDGSSVHLTSRELQVLEVLVQREGRVVRRAELIEQFGGATDDMSLRVIDTYVKSIRHKLGEARKHIGTVRGVGYRFQRNA